MRGTFIPTFVGKRFGLSLAADSTAKTNKLSGRTTLTCWNYLLDLFSICAVNIVFIGPLIKRYWFQQHAIVLHENTSSKASLAMSKTLRRCGPNVCCLPLSAVSWKDAWRGGCQLKSMHKIWCLAAPKKTRQKLVSTHAMKQNMFFFIFKVFHSSSPSHLWVPFCSRFCVDALRTKRGWWSSPWWSFLELINLWKTVPMRWTSYALRLRKLLQRFQRLFWRRPQRPDRELLRHQGIGKQNVCWFLNCDDWKCLIDLLIKFQRILLFEVGWGETMHQVSWTMFCRFLIYGCGEIDKSQGPSRKAQGDTVSILDVLRNVLDLLDKIHKIHK